MWTAMLASPLLLTAWCPVAPRGCTIWQEPSRQLVSHRSAYPTAALPPDAAQNWFVSVPRSLPATAAQAVRSTLLALRAGHRQLKVDAAIPELDPVSPAYRLVELIAFAQQLGVGVLDAQPSLLPRARPHLKLLFASPADATFAGGLVQYTNLPVSVLGASTSLGPKDGAFMVVAPRGGDKRIEDALEELQRSAGDRPVILLNPRLGNAALSERCETAYLLNPLTVSYMRDSGAAEANRAAACLLHCYPHEWSLMVDARRGGGWRYGGRFDRRPSVVQLEEMVQAAVTKEIARGGTQGERPQGGSAASGEE